MMMAVAAIVLAGYKPKADEQSSAPGHITLTVAPNLEGAYSIQLGITAQLLIIDWGDGSAAETYPKKTIYYDNVNAPHPVSHVYAGDGTYTVQIKGEGLTGFTCDYSNTTFLDVSGCPTLAQLRCSFNRLTSLDVSQCPALQELCCGDNPLTSLDVSQCPALQGLNCQGNRLTALDVSQCPALQELFCQDNRLTALDVSKCTALQSLDCSDNPLTSLDVNGCTALLSLECWSNQLTSLDVSKCPALEYLNCNGNPLTALDVGGCTALWELYCSGNQLSAAALDTIFTALPNRTVADDAHINISDNPGAESCNQAIAESKGWSFRDFYN
jgi:hypothetical protein